MTLFNKAIRFVVAIQIALSPSFMFGQQISAVEGEGGILEMHIPPMPEEADDENLLLGHQISQNFEIYVDGQAFPIEAAVTLFRTSNEEEVRKQIAWGELNNNGQKLPRFNVGVAGEPGITSITNDKELLDSFVHVEVPRNLIKKAKDYLKSKRAEWIESSPAYRAVDHAIGLLFTEYKPKPKEWITGVVRFTSVGAAIYAAYFFSNAHPDAAITTALALGSISGNLNAFGRAYADFTVFRGYIYEKYVPAFEFIANKLGLAPAEVAQIGIKGADSALLTMREALAESILVNLPNNIVKYAVIEVPILALMHMIFWAYGAPLQYVTGDPTEIDIFRTLFSIGTTTAAMTLGQGTFDIGLSVARDVQRTAIQRRVRRGEMTPEQAKSRITFNDNFYVYTLAAVGILANFAAAGKEMSQEPIVQNASMDVLTSLSSIGMVYLGVLLFKYDGFTRNGLKAIGRKTVGGCASMLQRIKSRLMPQSSNNN